MRPLIFRMAGGKIHRDAEFEMNFPVGPQSEKTEKELGAILKYALHVVQCPCLIHLHVAELPRSTMLNMRSIISELNPYAEWDVHTRSAVEIYDEMCPRQRQMLFLIPHFTDVQIANMLHMKPSYERDLHKQVNHMTDCHSKDDVSNFVEQLRHEGITSRDDAVSKQLSLEFDH